MMLTNIDDLDVAALRDLFRTLNSEWKSSGMVMKFTDAVKAEMVIRGMPETPRNWVLAGHDVICDLKAADYEDYNECSTEFD